MIFWRQRWETACVIALAAAGLALRLFVSWLPIDEVDRVLLVDDSYIALHVSRSLGIGSGPLGDSIHATNGYQPLYVWLMAPVFWIWPDDRVFPIHLALTLLSVCNALTGVLAFWVLRSVAQPGPAFVALALWSFWGPIVQIGINGLETSLSLLLVTASLYVFNRKAPQPTSNVVLGSLLGLAVLARIDNVLWVCLLVLFQLARGRGAAVRETVWTVAVAAVIALPWFLYNALAFGSIFPVSAEGTRFQTRIDVTGGMIPVGQWVARNFSSAFSSPFVRLYSAGLALFVVAIAILCWRKRLSTATRRTSAACGPLFVFSIVLVCFYCLAVGAYWYFYRYFYPLRLAFVLLTAVAIQIVLDVARDLGWEGWRRRVEVVLPCVVIVAAIAQFSTAWDSLIGGYREIGLWANTQLPEGAVVGATQSGSLAYYAERIKVVNLDGKVNREALLALKDKRMLEYATSSGVTHILDWRFNVEKLIVGRSSKNTLVLRTVVPTRTNSDWDLYELPR